MFGIILTSITTLMQLYVFWRMLTVSYITQYVSKKTIIGAGTLLWIVFFGGRCLRHSDIGIAGSILEFFGMNWLAILFLTFIPLIIADIFTLFGFLLSHVSSIVRGTALCIGMLLSLIAFIQGLRAPVIENYEINISGLSKDLDGTVIVALADMHLGSLLGEKWLNKRIDQVNTQKPDIIVLLGDIFEGHGGDNDALIASFKTLSAPKGVYAVLGNHEFHDRGSVPLYQEAGIPLLRDHWVEATPGLVMAGVDDLTSRRRRRYKGDTLTKALSGRPDGTTVFLSHTPWEMEKASKAGVDLMLSGHTHGGQIWPFDYLVKSRYPLLEGRYLVNSMAVIVSRGTGTWGPRMRLFSPGVIVRVTLRNHSLNSH